MTTDVSIRRAAALRGEIVALQLLVGLFLAARLYFDLTADPLGDETYYWMWGQHLDWSYFDHPPLQAWLMRLVASIAGWHPFSVRLLTWLSLAGVLAVFRALAVRMAPADPPLWFWRTAAIYLASPLFFGMTLISYNDHLVVAFSLAAIYAFTVFVHRIETGADRPWRWLYGAAIALGLATLSKYNGIFVGLGFALTLLLRPKLRPVLATPHPWLAALVAIAMQAPVLYWNATQGLASFRYHLDDRWGATAWQLHPGHPLIFVLFSLLVWSPVLIWPLVRLIAKRPAPDFEGCLRTVGLATFFASSIALVVISLPLQAYFYWNIVGFAAVMPLLTRYLGNPVLRTLHLLFGVVAAALVVVNFAVVPVNALRGADDFGTAINYGWNEVADHVRAAEAASPTDMVGSTRYSNTSQLGFALGITDAVRFGDELSEYTIWQRDEPMAGKSAMILVDDHDGDDVATSLRQHFDTLVEIDRFAIARLGYPVYAWRIYRGDDYRP